MAGLLAIFSVGILFFSITPMAFAEIGFNYDRQLISVNPDGSQTFKWTSHPDRMNDGTGYVDFIFTDMAGSLVVETQHGSVTLDKSSCGFSFHSKGLLDDNPIPLFTDSLIAKMATDGTDDWTHINSINNADCQASWNGQELTASKFKNGVGLLEYSLKEKLAW